MCRRYLAVALMLGGFTAAAAAQPAACPPPASTFELIQRGIFERRGCTLSYCHGADKKHGLDLRADAAYDSLLHHEEAGDELKMVDPGAPDNSALWLSLAAKTLERSDAAVTPMPLDALALTSDELEGVRLWIRAGARERGFVSRVSDLIDACPPPVSDDEGSLPVCDPNDPSLQLPDLHSEAPKDVRVVLNGSHRVIQFTSSVANDGQGPLIVQPATPGTQPGQWLDAVQVIHRTDGSKCAHPAGVIGYQEEGRLWAYGNLATYELRKNDPLTGDVVVRTSKTAYCLLDTDPIRSSANMPHQYEAHCKDTVGRMGISVGYMDVYHRDHPGQWLDIDQDPGTLIEPGQYYLVNIANPAELLWETDDSRNDNLGYTTVSVPFADQDATASDAQPTPAVEPTPQPAVGPARGPHAPQHPTVVRPTRAPRAVRTPRPSNAVHQPGAAQAERTAQPKRPVRTVRPRPTPRPKPTPRPRP